MPEGTILKIRTTKKDGSPLITAKGNPWCLILLDTLDDDLPYFGSMEGLSKGMKVQYTTRPGPAGKGPGIDEIWDASKPRPEKKSGGFGGRGGGGFAPRSPEERASIEKQSCASSSSRITAACVTQGMFKDWQEACDAAVMIAQALHSWVATKPTPKETPKRVVVADADAFGEEPMQEPGL